MDWNRLLKVILGCLLVVILGLAGVAGYYYYRTDNALSKIERHDYLPGGSANLPEEARITGAMNILLLGTDSRGTGDQGRSDTIMLAHIPENRDTVYLVSLPRDLYVPIPGHRDNKLNMAYGNGGPALAAQTVSQLLGVHIDHIATLDFSGFITLVDSLGGVTIDNPFEACDTSQNHCWQKGVQSINREEALRYVRWRHGLPEGDISRNQNQQRVVKAIINKIVSTGTVKDPNRIVDVLDNLSNYMTLDKQFTNEKIIKTALSMRVTSGNDVKSFIIPIKEYRNDPALGSLDIIDESRMSELKEAFRKNDLESYYVKHKDTPVFAGSSQ